jgi:hypothetical protein
MKIIGTISITLALALAAGCGTSGPKLDMNKVAKMYYEQQRTRVYPAIEISNVNDLHVTGSNMHFVVNTHMEPLNIVPRDPTFMETAVPAAKDVILGGLGIMGAAQVMSKMAEQPRTVSPLVVHPDVVQPQVIQVPAGGQ